MVDRHSGPPAAGQEPPGQAWAEAEPPARVRQYRVAQARCQAALELPARGRPAERPKAVPAAAVRPSEREPSVRARVEWAPPDQAGGSSLGAVSTEPTATALCRVATGHPAYGRPAGQPRAGRDRSGQLGPVQVPRVQLRAAGPGPPAGGLDGAERCRRTERLRHWAGPAALLAGRAKAAAQSAPEPPRELAAPPVEQAEQSGRAPCLRAGPGGAAVEARPGPREARPAAQGDERSAREPAALTGGRDVPARPGSDAPVHLEAAGGAGPAGRHRRAAPGRAGAMERRNCPATTGWRG
ncbi:hypothetical protein SAMN05428997_111134 [Bosea sp. CRIB-10]|nr:hypothetical protein SAMN05428997_111134 [Bosea sp. CRIB-10]